MTSRGTQCAARSCRSTTRCPADPGGTVPAPPISPRSPSALLLALVFSAVLRSFLVAAYVTHRLSEEVDAHSDRMVATFIPAIERLAALQRLTLEVELALSHYLYVDPSEREAAASSLEASLS